MALVHPINPKSVFAQELREEFAKGEVLGMEKGMEMGAQLEIQRNLRDKINTIQGMLSKGCDWAFIQDIMHTDEAGFEELKKSLR